MGGDAITLTLDEDDLVDGSDTTKESLTTSDTLAFTAGTDALVITSYSIHYTKLYEIFHPYGDASFEVVHHAVRPSIRAIEARLSASSAARSASVA